MAKLETSRSRRVSEVRHLACVFPLWKRIRRARRYARHWSQEDGLAYVQEAGLWLQRFLAEPSQSESHLIEQLTKELMSLAKLNEPPTPDLARVGAAFHLWPLYSAIYYGYRTATPDERTGARSALCAIQKLLMADLRLTVDFLRASFAVDTDAKIIEMGYLTEPKVRVENWRHRHLIMDVRKRGLPDLCEVDYLGAEAVELERQTRGLFEATEIIHNFALGEGSPTQDDFGKVSQVLRRLRVAQMTFFSKLTLGDESNPQLHEVVAVTDSNMMKGMVPFHVENSAGILEIDDPEADRFRKLADHIYSADETHTAFAKQRELTITGKGGMNFISDGETSYDLIKANFDFWPVTSDAATPDKGQFWWYACSLENMPQCECGIADWSDNRWWKSLPVKQFLSCLLPVGRTKRSKKFLHENAHASALWDFLVRRTGRFCDTWDQLHEWLRSPDLPRNDGPRFGFLLEGLLRRGEQRCRTSVFFALDRFADYGSDERLHQFAGGTLSGVERPGIPFEEARFENIARRILPTVLAVADSCITLGRDQRKRVLKERKGVRDSVLCLLNTFPFAVGGRQEDHDISSENLNKLPFLKELVGIVPGIRNHWNDTKKDYSSCTKTQKNLFFCFESGIVPNERDLPNLLDLPSPPTSGYHEVSCLDCLNVVLDRLVPGVDRHPLPPVQWDNAVCATLPSRPGIRFIVAVADFLYAVELGRQQRTNEGTAYAWVSKIQLKPGSLSIQWSRNAKDFLYVLLENYTNNQHSLGRALRRINYSTLEHIDKIGLTQRIHDLLISPKLCRLVNVVVEPEQDEIKFKWKVGTQ